MKVIEEHKTLLKSLGLKDEDLEQFDGTSVTYGFDPAKGVRLYDPNYETSYNEYIDVDGWSAWSSENNTFMGDILKGTREEVESRERMGRELSQEELAQTLGKKSRRKTEPDT